MNHKFFKPFGLFLALFATSLFVGCQNEDSAADVEDYVLQSVYEIEERSGTGMAGCYELVFPVTVQFPDSTTLEVLSYEELKQAIRNWFQTNKVHPRPHSRPYLVFPYEVINEAGEVITISNFEELVELRRACIHDGFGPNHHGHLGKDRHCFRPVFPLTLEFPDGTQVIVTTPREMQHAIHEWRHDNPGSTERPQFVFPITVELRDGTQVVVNSAEELAALKEECRG
ncbi:MAG TPA: hypothetical protein VMZ69_10745 [Saprospiraceae bacterium]|nr:hypothetical protein [Saprospiraceae bacterium]